MDSQGEQLGAGWRHTSSPIGSILGPRLVDTLGATWIILPTRPAARDFHNQQTRKAGKVDVMAERTPYTCYTDAIIISDKFRTRQFFLNSCSNMVDADVGRSWGAWGLLVDAVGPFRNAFWKLTPGREIVLPEVKNVAECFFVACKVH